MARCRFPGPSIARSYKSILNKSSCDGRARYTIVYQGKTIEVCKVHRQYDGRNGLM